MKNKYKLVKKSYTKIRLNELRKEEMIEKSFTVLFGLGSISLFALAANLLPEYRSIEPEIYMGSIVCATAGISSAILLHNRPESKNSRNEIKTLKKEIKEEKAFEEANNKKR